MQPRPSGGLRSFCALAALLTAAAWPAAAHARVDPGRAGTDQTASDAAQPQLWGVEIGPHARTFLRSAYLGQMRHSGINALVVDPRRLTLNQLRATVKAAKRANLWLIELVPPAHAKATRSIKAVRATCRAAHQPAETLCAASVGSIATAIALSRSGPPDRTAAVRLTGPAQLAKLRGAGSSGSRILALAKLRAHNYATSAWQDAIGVAGAMSSVDLAVTPTGTSKHALSDYLHQLGKPPSAPGPLVETASTASTISIVWAPATDKVGITEYNITANGKFAGKTATTKFTVGGLGCAKPYKLAVTARNAAGRTSTASTLMASTAACPDVTPPTASITAPANGATVSGAVSVSASAGDNVAVARAEFWIDGGKKATDTSAPYNYSWDTTTVADGPHTILVKAFDTSDNSSSASITVTVSNSTPCVTSSASWQNTAMLSPDGTFDVSFDATPSAGNVDAVTGLSAAPAAAYGDLAVIARFNSSGSIDAINGGGYAAADTVPYAGGSTYHFHAVVNVPSHTYSLYVTPPGKLETPVALNYAFRTGQGGVSALSNWAVMADAGSHQTCGVAVANPTDMTAPSAPTGLAKTNSTQTSLSVSWAGSTDNVGVAGYTVYVNGAASSAAAGTSRTISGLGCGTTYTIGVDAYDSAGNHSTQTSTTMATSTCPGDTTPPSTPTNLGQSSSTATSVTFSWTASTDDVGVTGYTLYVNGAQVGTTTGTSATATGLSCGTAYTVGIDAFDAAGNHSAKASISASTGACSGDTTPPSAPTGLATSGVGASAATLSWTASTDNVGVTGYRLFRDGTQVGTSSATTYQFTGLSCATIYTLGVAAVDAAGNVSSTATASVTTSACPTANLYLAQNAAGNGDGSSCANAKAVSFFNTASNWGAGKPVAPGTTVALCGTITSQLTFQGSGTNGNPITVQFQPGAKISRSTCSCFDASGRSFVVIDGGSNGVIEATNNGVNLGTRQATRAVDLQGCQSCTVENLTISNIFVMVPGNSDPIDHTQSNAIYADGANLSVHDNVIHDVGWAIYDNNGTNSRIYDNDITHMDHGITLSGSGDGPVFIYGNHIHDMANWDCGGGCHHDGIHCYTVAGGSPNHYGNGGILIYDNRFDGTVGSDNTSPLFLESNSGSGATPCADATTDVYIFNNFVHPTDHPVNNGVITPASGRIWVYDNTLVGYSNTTGYIFDCCAGWNGLGAFENNVLSTADRFGGWPTSLFNPIDYNVYANTDAPSQGNSAWTCNSTSTDTFATFRACAGDTHGQAVSSAQLNTDGSPQATSPVLNAGANLSSLCTGNLVPLCSDINGHPRPTTGSWDAGAFEVSH